jgi:very-short-patch-repair endonuclease
MLVVEVGGGQHADSQTDKVRDVSLSAAGYRVLRFWNSDVLANREGVLLTIADALNQG